MGSWTLRVSVSEKKGALQGLGKELEHQKLCAGRGGSGGGGGVSS